MPNFKAIKLFIIFIINKGGFQFKTLYIFMYFLVIPLNIHTCISSCRVSFLTKIHVSLDMELYNFSLLLLPILGGDFQKQT